ncbi:MAG: PAS domain-containing protein, partial [Deltaproteobacteria bacterium]|nr:PAS domain-containing protein [Deltaproteobacteria bacterium]
MQPAITELLRTLPTASAIVDRELSVLVANPQWSDCFGLEGELEGRSLGELVPGMHEEWKHALELCLAGETCSRAAGEWRHGDRLERLDWTMSP